MREDVSLEVVDFDERDLKSLGETFGEGYADEEGAEKAGASSEGDGVDVGEVDARLFDGGGYDWHDVLLVGAGGEFWDDASILAMDFLGCYYVGEEVLVAEDGS